MAGIASEAVISLTVDEGDVPSSVENAKAGVAG